MTPDVSAVNAAAKAQAHMIACLNRLEEWMRPLKEVDQDWQQVHHCMRLAAVIIGEKLHDVSKEVRSPRQVEQALGERW